MKISERNLSNMEWEGFVKVKVYYDDVFWWVLK